MFVLLSLVASGGIVYVCVVLPVHHVLTARLNVDGVPAGRFIGMLVCHSDCKMGVSNAHNASL